MTQIDAGVYRAPSEGRRAGYNFAALAGAVVVTLILGVASYGKLISSPGLLDYLIVAGQAAMVAFVWVFHRKWFAWLVVTLMFSTFAGYTSSHWMAGESCACFGDLTIAGVKMTSGVTLAIDLFGIAIGLGLMSAPGQRSIGSVGLLATLVLGAVVLGWGVAEATATPPQGSWIATAPAGNGGEGDGSTTSQMSPGKNAVEVLWEQPFMREIVNPAPGSPAWLVYIYNIECPTCQEHLVHLNAYSAARPDDGTLRVRTFMMQEMEEELGIPLWAWPSVPTLLLVQDGEVTMQYPAKDLPMPEDVRAKLAAEDPDADPLAVLRDQRETRRLFSEPPAAPTLIYLYNPNCEICIKHLADMNAFEEQTGGDDPNLQIVKVDLLTLEERGVPLYHWPSVPYSALMIDGKITRRYNAAQTPDPFELWAEFSQ